MKSFDEMKEKLGYANLVFYTNFFISLGLENPDEIANRFVIESKAHFQKFLKDESEGKYRGDGTNPDGTPDGSKAVE